MALIDTIKAALLEARKARHANNTASLSTLVGECETLAKAGKGDLTDAVVVTIIKKFLKNNGDAQGALIDSMDPNSNVTPPGAVKLMNERELFLSFLPKQLSEAELRALIKAMITNGCLDVGSAMKRLKTDYAGMYDGALASAILKQEFGK